jgi:hypothetical protein
MVLLPFLIYNKDESLNGNMVFVAALVMGVLGFICFQFMIKNTEIREEQQILLNEPKEKFNVFKAIGNFLKNRPAMGATIAAMGMFIGMQGAATAVSVTFQIYFKNTQISGIVQMFAMIPIVLFTPLARKMVTKFGMSEKLGLVSYGNDNNEVFLGRDFSSTPNYSEKTAATIDNEIESIVMTQYKKALDLLNGAMGKVHEVAKILFENEKISGEEFIAIMEKE